MKETERQEKIEKLEERIAKNIPLSPNDHTWLLDQYKMQEMELDYEQSKRKEKFLFIMGIFVIFLSCTAFILVITYLTKMFIE